LFIVFGVLMWVWCFTVKFCCLG